MKSLTCLEVCKLHFKLESVYQSKLEFIAEPKRSILQKAFTGEFSPPQVGRAVSF